jgi:hypothetical protein
MQCTHEQDNLPLNDQQVLIFESDCGECTIIMLWRIDLSVVALRNRAPNPRLSST